MRSESIHVLSLLVLVMLLGGVPGHASGPDADNGTVVAVPPPVGTEGDIVTRNNPWVALPACPTGVSRPAGAVVGGHFFIVGGEPRDGYVQEYDPGTTSWTTNSGIMPTPLSNICAAVIGTDIYVPGGWTGSAGVTNLQVYDTVGDSWQTIATDPLPVARYASACTASGGKLYVIGGTTTDTVYIYDPAAAAGSRWTTGANAPAAGSYGDAVAFGAYIYYAGLYNAGDQSGVYRYDVAGNSWTTMPSLNTARGGAQVWIYEGLLAVGGGGWSSYLTSVEEYDLSTGTGGTWSAGNSLVTGRRTFAGAQDWVSGVLYAGAGWAGAYLTAADSSTYVVPVELMSFSVD